jgi:hypothetical protein
MPTIARGVPDLPLIVTGRPLQESTVRLYGRVDLTLRGPAALARGVAEYFWPQVQSAPVASDRATIELVHGTVDPAVLAGLPREEIVLYRSPDGYVPDFNTGLRYHPDGAVDRLVTNPHTGTHFLVTGVQVRVLNADPKLGVRDAVRVALQLAAADAEARGGGTVHASAFAVGGQVVAMTGPKGAGKTTTVLAAVAAGATLISNDRLFAWTSDAGTMVQGWADPIRVIRRGPDLPKDIIPLVRYFRGQRRRVATEPLRLSTVVVPHVTPAATGVSCVELDPVEGRAAIAGQVLPPRRRWLGIEPEPGPPGLTVTADRYLRLTYPLPAARAAVAALIDALN